MRKKIIFAGLILLFGIGFWFKREIYLYSHASVRAYLAAIKKVPTPTLPKDSLTIDKHLRTFEYFVPENLEAGAQLIFVLHGSGGSGQLIRITTGQGFETQARQTKNAIIVYPQAYKNYWNDCRRVADYPSKLENIQDTRFFGEMIAYFEQKFGINPQKVSAVGYSNGGQMCLKLGFEMPEKIQKIACVAANIPTPDNNDCNLSQKPVSVLFLHGTDDPISPYVGGEIGGVDAYKRGTVLSTAESVQYWKNINASDSAIYTQKIYPDTCQTDNSTLVGSVFQNPKTGFQTIFLEAKGQGHTFPNPTFQTWATPVVGNVNREVDATALIFDFFNGQFKQ